MWADVGENRKGGGKRLKRGCLWRERVLGPPRLPGEAVKFSVTEKQSGDMWIFLWWGLESRSAFPSNLSHIQSLASTHPPAFYSTAQFQMGHWMVKAY